MKFLKLTEVSFNYEDSGPPKLIPVDTVYIDANKISSMKKHCGATYIVVNSHGFSVAESIDDILTMQPIYGKGS